MGWSFPWVSCGNSDFNFDLGFSYTDEQVREFAGPMLDGGAPSGVVANAAASGTDIPGYLTEGPGFSAFIEDDGAVFHTYSTHARGLEFLTGTTRSSIGRPRDATRTEAFPGSAATTSTDERGRAPRAPRRVRSSSSGDGVEEDGFRDALQVHRAHRLEGDTVRDHAIDDLLRDEDLARRRLFRDPRGEVDRATEVVASLEDHRSGLEPDVRGRQARAATASRSSSAAAGTASSARRKWSITPSPSHFTTLPPWRSACRWTSGVSRVASSAAASSPRSSVSRV